jgi:hypothetical protein
MFYPQIGLVAEIAIISREKPAAEYNFTYDFHCRAMHQMTRISSTKSNLICGYNITAISV